MVQRKCKPVANDQWAAHLLEEPKLSRAEATDGEAGGSMLSVTVINRFYYLRDFTDMRCKYSRVLSIMREQLHREPSDGDVLSSTLTYHRTKARASGTGIDLAPSC